MRYVQLAAAPVCETGLADPSNLVCHGMLCFSWAARDAMPRPCHHARRPRGDSVPSVIILFRVDRRRIPVESSHLQNVRHARQGASPPLACNSGSRRLRPSPNPQRRAESGNLTCTGGTAHSICCRIYRCCCEANACHLLLKGLAMLILLLQHVRLARRRQRWPWDRYHRSSHRLTSLLWPGKARAWLSLCGPCDIAHEVRSLHQAD